MKSTENTLQVQRLATALALVGAYIAVRVSLYLPRFQIMFSEVDTSDEGVSAGRFILMHHYAFIALISAVLIVTLFAIWKPFKHHSIVYSIGIGLLFLLGDRALASILDPFMRMISVMSEQ
jgi:hypothetical protein